MKGKTLLTPVAVGASDVVAPDVSVCKNCVENLVRRMSACLRVPNLGRLGSARKPRGNA